MAKRTVELQIQLQNAKSINDVELALKDINKELKTLDVNSDAFKKLSETAKQADNSLKTVKDELRGISDEKQLDSVAKLGGTLAASFSIATVAASSFGAKTEQEIQKAIQVATQLTVVVSSIKPLMEGLTGANRRAFVEYAKGLGSVITNFKQSAAAATLFGNASRTALSLSVIGAAITALVLLVQHWNDVTDAIGLTNNAADKLFESQAEGLKNANELIEIYNKRLKESTDFQTALLEAEGKGRAAIIEQKKQDLELEYQLLGARERNLKLLIQETQLNIQDEEIVDKQKYIDLLKEQEAQLISIQNAQVDNLRIQVLLTKQLETFNREQGEKAAKEAKDAAEKLAKELKAAQEKLQKENEKAQKERIEAIDKFRIKSNKETNEAIEKDDKARQESLASSTEQLAKDIVSSEQEIWDAVQVLKKREEQEEKERAKAKLQAQIDYYKNLGDLTEEQESILGELRKEKALQLKAELEEILAAASPFIDQIGQLSAAINEGIQRNIDSTAKQIEVLDTDIQESISTQRALEAELADAQGAQREQILESIDDERKKEQQLAKEKKKLQNESIKQQNKLNQVNWANQLIQAIRDTASAVAQALPSIPLSILAGAIGAIQIGIVASNKPEIIPSAAKGGAPFGFTGPGGAIDSTGEKKAGIVQLHANEWVAPRWQVEHPVYGAMIQQLEQVRQAKPMATGGFSPESLPAITPDINSFNTLTAESIKAAVESAIIYTVATEVRDSINAVNLIQDRASA